MSAKIVPFPSARRPATLERIVGVMSRHPAIDEAERTLVDFLEIYWEKLEAIGVGHEEIEHECREFAVAAWARFQDNMREPGVA